MNDDLKLDVSLCIAKDWDHEFDSIKEHLGKLKEWIVEPDVARAYEKLRKINPSVVSPIALLRRKVSLMFNPRR